MSRKKKIYKKKGKIIKDLTKNIFKILNTDSSKHYNLNKYLPNLVFLIQMEKHKSFKNL